MRGLMLAAALSVAFLAAPASASFITSLPGGTSAEIPAANKMSKGPEPFGPLGSPIIFTASQDMALFGYTGSYITDDYTGWASGGIPLIGNNIESPASFSLTFAVPIAAFAAEMNWDRRFGQAVSFSAYDVMGNLIETGLLNDGTGVVASNLYSRGGTYGLSEATADISRIDFTNAGLAIRNLTFSATPVAASDVPEPASWALMIGGLGIAGAAVRRRTAARTA